MWLRPFAVLLLVLLAGIALSACARSETTRHSLAASAAGADLGRGGVVYAAQCAACHGAGGVGGRIGPPLRNERLRRSFDAVVKIVEDPSSPMPELYPGELTKRDVYDVSAYVESLR